MTDMFDNRKIKQIRHLPEGNNIVLIWVMLLTMAGRCNASGMIFLTENIPYTVESLAIELDFDQTVVKLAIDVLRKFGMIVCDENEFSICGWEEHQNVEGMEKIREQNRLRKQAQRAKEKLLSSNNNVSRDTSRDVTAVSHQSHAIEKEIEKEKELDLEKECINTSVKPEKITGTNIKPVDTPLSTHVYDGFEDWWDLYPKKSGDIRLAYQEYLFALDDVTSEELVKALKNQTENMTEDELRYFPSADKWLRNRTWLKKVTPKKSTQRVFVPTEF